MLPFRVLELSLHDIVKLLAEWLDVHVALGMFLVEPADVDHIRDARDVPPPVAVLLLAPRLTIPVQNRLNILNMLDCEVLAVGVKVDIDGEVRHQESSVTQSVPAVVVTRPLVAALRADIFWPGETVMTVSQFAGRNGSAVVAVAVPVES